MRTLRIGTVLTLGLLAAQAAMGVPDVIVSTIGTNSGSGQIIMHGTAGGISAYSLGSVSCNIGTSDAIWFDNTPDHPVIGQQMYRLKDNRFEQIGMSWLKHGFCAADANGCTNLGPPGSAYRPNSSCDWLGLYATDTYSASLNANQGLLGPRSEINPSTGAYPYPYTLNWGSGLPSGENSCLYKRLQIAPADLLVALNPGARYFAEIHYITSDEAPADRLNNASYREMRASGGATTNFGCTEAGVGLSFVAPTVPMQPAIMAWKTVDDSVVLRAIDVPGDGRFWLAAKVWEAPAGVWNYEYALYNHNSRRGASSFSITKPRRFAINDVGFHGVRYHSGEAYDQTPWTNEDRGTELAWTAATRSIVANTNALRWSTTYNFRFTSARAPDPAGSASITLFQAGEPGDPGVISVPGVPVPSVPTTPPPCPVDFDADGVKTPSDIFAYLNAYFAGDLRADFDQSLSLTPSDIFAFISAYFSTTCP